MEALREERQEVVVRREIPLPKDGKGRTRSGELLRCIRQLVLSGRTCSPAAGRTLSEVGLKTRSESDTMEVFLHYR